MTRLLLSIVFSGLVIRSSASEDEVFHMNLEQLMQVKVSTASISDRPVREQPGIVSVISEKEIRSSGAEYLMDLLEIGRAHV